MSEQKRKVGRPPLKNPRTVKLAGVRVTEAEYKHYQKIAEIDTLNPNPDGEFAEWVRTLMSRRAQQVARNQSVTKRASKKPAAKKKSAAKKKPTAKKKPSGQRGMIRKKVARCR